MATASSFEAYTQPDGYQTYSAADAQAAPAAAPMLVPGVGTGYREITHHHSQQSSPLAVLLMACVGIGLGVLAGTWLATGSLNFNALLHPPKLMSPAAPQPPFKAAAKPSLKPLAPLSADHASSVGMAAAIAAAPKPIEALIPAAVAPVLPEPAPAISVPTSAAPKSAPLANKARLVPVATKSAKTASAAHTKKLGRTLHVLSPRKRRNLAPARALAAMVKLPAPTPVSIESAVPAIRVIEGDVTVANFDESSGLIETHEGKSFRLGRTFDAPNSIPWQDFRANLHYRCDQLGRCSLARNGAISPDAKLLL